MSVYVRSCIYDMVVTENGLSTVSLLMEDCRIVGLKNLSFINKTILMANVYAN